MDKIKYTNGLRLAYIYLVLFAFFYMMSSFIACHNINTFFFIDYPYEREAFRKGVYRIIIAGLFVASVVFCFAIYSISKASKDKELRNWNIALFIIQSYSLMQILAFREHHRSGFFKYVINFPSADVINLLVSIMLVGLCFVLIHYRLARIFENKYFIKYGYFFLGLSIFNCIDGIIGGARVGFLTPVKWIVNIAFIFAFIEYVSAWLATKKRSDGRRDQVSA